ncbi:triose-phosphate isomerase [Alkalicaulis satelles]|uniref:Triosephosphate isomerase n=1 Tax=Alkalicaulis satelles TaxID=2609175 RepID=A0A5M6ZJ43_9PROT|nr:triose-phosphate isomerase [Alkalicaulis satelles]KAA5804836.1 triose-phosphate isomerase [Alkalicaulis satelles]
MARRKIIAGNWKMHGRSADLGWAERLSALFDAPPSSEVLVFPPATLLAPLSVRLPGYVAIGGQDCADAAEGARTGDISPLMLSDLGARYVITGHSERRMLHGESDAVVRAKTEAALKAGLTPVVCVGETLDQRRSGEAQNIVLQQLQASLPEAAAGHVIIAYEPVWAIGTGMTASPDDAEAMHKAIRQALRSGSGDELRILYGGSVNPANAAELLSRAQIDGALVGGASLDPESFASIIRSAG